jgi:predicted nucleic acid-binding protein
MKGDEIIAVLDAGPLIHLDEIESLHLLCGYREVLLPEIVEREALAHRPGIQLSSIPHLMRIAAPVSISDSLFATAVEFGAHAGELAAIAALRRHHGDCLLSDDAAARAMAEALGFQVRGTVGLILRGWIRGEVTKAAARGLLRALPKKSTLYLRARFLEEILQQLND